MYNIQDKPRICLKCVSPGSKNTGKEGGEAPHSYSLPPVSPKEEDRGCYLCLFSMAAELCLGSLFASRNKFECNQVSYLICSHFLCEQESVPNVSRTLCFSAGQPLPFACFQTALGLHLNDPLMQQH